MKSNHVKSAVYYMRSLHRDIGYLMLGLTLIYALSGVVLVYRETGFLKSPVRVEKTLSQQMSPDEIARNLRMRRLEVTKSDSDLVHFQDPITHKEGVYNPKTGAVEYVEDRYPSFIESLIHLHMLGSSQAAHVVSVVYGAALLFLAVSSLWMFKTGTRRFRRALVMSGAGVGLAIVLLAIL